MSFFEVKQKRERKKKQIVLRVNYEDVEKKFGLTPTQLVDKKTHSNLTSISNTADVVSQQTLSDKRKSKNIFVHSVDLCLNPMPEKTGLCCYWCKHTFELRPIGCPIKMYINDNGETVYETYKIFCGFSCLFAHIKFVKKYNIDEHIYKESDVLMYQMFLDIYERLPTQNEITEAPDWQLLKEYGGPYTIDDFRKLNDSLYISSTNMRVRPFPIMICSSDIYEKRCVF